MDTRRGVPEGVLEGVRDQKEPATSSRARISKVHETERRLRTKLSRFRKTDHVGTGKMSGGKGGEVRHVGHDGG